jgi:hypothetical protein
MEVKQQSAIQSNDEHLHPGQSKWLKALRVFAARQHPQRNQNTYPCNIKSNNLFSFERSVNAGVHPSRSGFRRARYVRFGAASTWRAASKLGCWL